MKVRSNGFLKIIPGKTFRWIFIGLFIFSAGMSSAQWSKQNLEWPNSSLPWLSYPMLSDVHFLDANKGFAVGPEGMVMASADGGRTWDFLNLQTDRNLYTITSSTNDILWITGNKRLFRSPDRGVSWERISQFELYNVKDIFFLNASLGWAAADDKVFSTSDGGTTWSGINQTSFTAHVNKIGFNTASFGWAVTSDGKLWLTDDGGAHWAESIVPSGFFCHAADFANTTTGYACGLYWPGGAVCKTTNGGASWEIVQQYLGYNDILVLSPDLYIVIGEAGILDYMSDDPGTYAHLPYTGSFCDWTRISRDRTGDFRVCGETGGSMMHSADGIHWEMKWTASDQEWNSVFFTDSLTGYAATYEELWKTEDGGKHWFLAWFKDGFRMIDLFFIDKNHGWVSGEEAKIFHTSDGGFTWYPKYDALDFWNDLVSIQFADPQHGWAANKQKRKILFTVNGGNHWEYLDYTAPGYINDLWFSDLNHGWLVGDDGTICHTTDGGNTWVQQTGQTFADLHSVHFVDSLAGFTAGASGKIQFTEDGGASWSVRNSQTMQDLHHIYFTDRMHGWACGEAGTIIHTKDGGITWTVEVSDNERIMRRVFAVGANKAWAVGTEGQILHADYAQFQKVPEIIYNQSFSASVQPNPCRERALITFAGGAGEKITIRVFDLSGRSCFSMESPATGQTEGQVEIPLEAFPDGIYIAKISDGQEVLNLKIIHSGR